MERTGDGVSTRGGTLHSRRFGYVEGVLTGIARVTHDLEIMPVGRASAQ